MYRILIIETGEYVLIGGAGFLYTPEEIKKHKYLMTEFSPVSSSTKKEIKEIIRNGTYIEINGLEIDLFSNPKVYEIVEV